VITYRFEDTIERSADEVWAYAADITRHPEWMGVLDAEVISGRPTEVGAMGRETVRFGPWVASRICWKSSDGAGSLAGVG